ncbi:MAG TPA: hypothetical protein VK585_17315 [Jiangellaceae bacterium]|nr:hypothetical protein [Jiangellaceae bacterium]
MTEIGQHVGPVELVLLGDFLDLQRMGPTGQVNDRVTATLMRPDYAELFDALRGFRSAAGHRVTYVVGNHDAELWWNVHLQDVLRDAGLVDEFALSYAARFESLHDQLIHGEHGNQFDPTNRFADYGDPLDTPIGAHVVDEIVRPIGSSTRLTGNLDLRDVSFVFPLAAIPEWIASRIFYRFLGEVLRWIAVLFVIANVAHLILIWIGSSDAQRTTRTILAEVAYDVGLLILICAVVFVVGRRTARRASSLLALRLAGASSDSEPTRIRRALLAEDPLPVGAGVAPRNIAVFVSAHTHAPSSTQLRRDDETTTAVVNTGCWLRQLQPVPTRFGAPNVFVPMFVQTHVRVQRSHEGVVVELWDRPRPARRMLLWIERAAIAGRMPKDVPSPTTSRLLDRQLIPGRMRAST